MENVKIVMLQFSFGNKNNLSPWLWEDKAETPQTRKERKSRVPGVEIIAPTQDNRINISGLPVALMEEGFKLVEAFGQKRLDVHRGQGTYFMARFVFGRADEVRINSSYQQILDQYLFPDLLKLCSYCWRVRAYLNPFYREGVLVPDTKHLSVNFEAKNNLPLEKATGVLCLKEER